MQRQPPSLDLYRTYRTQSRVGSECTTWFVLYMVVLVTGIHVDTDACECVVFVHVCENHQSPHAHTAHTIHPRHRPRHNPPPPPPFWAFWAFWWRALG